MSLKQPDNHFKIIPAIDLIDGKCVRLSQGDYAQKIVYNEHPLEVAKMFEDAGLQRLHLVDLDGAKAGKVTNWKVLEALATKTNLAIDFGGGIKAVADVALVFNSGAQLATIGSMAVKNSALFQEIISQFGASKFFLGADVKAEKIAVSGWLETTDVHILDFINDYQAKGITQFFCTDISKDGMMQGPGIALYKTMLANTPNLNLTASGGVSSIADLQQLQAIGCSGAIVGKAIYEGAITLKQLSSF
jgi:phosphoribosylformimino-5-aminoimidazole carboxamide ribotide isomerase